MTSHELRQLEDQLADLYETFVNALADSDNFEDVEVAVKSYADAAQPLFSHPDAYYHNVGEMNKLAEDRKEELTRPKMKSQSVDEAMKGAIKRMMKSNHRTDFDTEYFNTPSDHYEAERELETITK